MKTSKEVILRTINFTGPGRLGFDYYAYGKRHTDIITSYLDWECQYEKKTYADGKKEYYTDVYGNWWARVIADKSTKGEIYKGVLEDWKDLENYQMPRLSYPDNFTGWANHPPVKVGRSASPLKVCCMGYLS